MGEMTLNTAFFFCLQENIGIRDKNLFEGDMVLTAAQRNAAMTGRDISKAGIGRGSIFRNLWPGAVMPYTIDRYLGEYMIVEREREREREREGGREGERELG